VLRGRCAVEVRGGGARNVLRFAGHVNRGGSLARAAGACCLAPASRQPQRHDELGILFANVERW
jgi:hypothetical protein